MRWIRLEVAFDESWLFPLSPAAQLAWIKLLCTCKRDGVRGDMKFIAPIVAARKWAVPVKDVEAMYAAASVDGALVIEGEQMTVTNWLKYNPLDRTAADRKRRERGHTTSRPVTDGHGVTASDSVTKRDHLSRDMVPNRVTALTTKATTLGSVEPKPTKAVRKYPHFPTADSDRLHAACLDGGYVVEVSMLRKTLAPLYSSSGPLHSIESLESALVAFLEARGSVSPDKARFWTITQFAADIGRWLRMGAMPRQDPETGAPTERGMLLMGAA